MFQRYMPLVKELYKLFSGKNDLPGKTKTMCLEEFTDIWESTGLATDHFGTREINNAFIHSQQTEVTELDTLKHL